MRAPWKFVLLVLALSTMFASCGGRHELSPEEQQQVSALKGELGGIDQEIAAAEKVDSLYSGGLIKALISVRLEVLRTSRALVQQRIHAIESGAPVKLQTLAATPNPERAQQLSKEIEAQEAAVAVARREADMYSGGLVGALKASTVATEENTLAMLRQQYIFAQYGLVWPSQPESQQSATEPSSQASPSPAGGTVTVPLGPPPMEKQEIFEIIEVDARVTEANSSWSKYAWKLTVRNLTPESVSLEGIIEFQDSEGFVVDDDREYDLVLGPNEQQTFTGYDLIDSAVAPKVASVSAKVKQR